MVSTFIGKGIQETISLLEIINPTGRTQGYLILSRFKHLNQVCQIGLQMIQHNTKSVHLNA